jgi:hypothetical protein
MRYLLLAAVLALVLLAAGCTTSAPQAVQTAVGAVHVELTSIADYSTGNPYMTPRPGYGFVAADFAIINDGATSYHFTPLSAHLHDSAGYSYSYSVWSGSVPGYFGLTDIPAGQTSRGKLLFEVPEAPAGTEYRLTI